MTTPVTPPAGGQRGRPPGEPEPFDDFGDRYARFDELRARLMPATGDWLRAHLPGGRRAVDLGCGYGRHAGLLAGRYEQVLAVDVSARMLAIARTRWHRPNIRYQQRGVLDVTTHQDGEFDAVVSVNTLHHVGPLATVLPAVRRLLAPGGRLVLIDIVDPGGWGDHDWHVGQAFDAARDFYRLAGGDPEAAVAVIRIMLHPRWLRMMCADIPPSRQRFHHHVREVFPDATIADDLHPVLCGVLWQAPGLPDR